MIALLLWIFLVHQDGEIKEGGGPGIVPFEVAGSADRTQEILGEWGGEGQDAATVSLLVDYPYLIAYGIFLGVACGAVSIRLARRGRERLARAGGLIGWGALGAAVFDAIEDGALLRMLDGHTDGWPTLALIAAIGKFTLFALAVIYILAGLFLSRGGLKAAEAA
ncbi:MAG: hypothetical protein EXQ70_01295 [Solirubrobacterales bacterium]|nr:hypothetical protein [Solirubrobacterales bacterium]